MTTVNAYPELTQDNAHLVLSQATLAANRAAELAIKEFAFSPDLRSHMLSHVENFIETGEEKHLTLVTLYLTKLREEKENQQLEEEERAADKQREEKVRSDAEEDRHLMFLQSNHSRRALH